MGATEVTSVAQSPTGDTHGLLNPPSAIYWWCYFSSPPASPSPSCEYLSLTLTPQRHLSTGKIAADSKGHHDQF